MFTGKVPDLVRSRIFGCLVYCHVSTDKCTKLDATAEKGILVGYNETSKAYKVYIPALRKTVLTRDVKFEENIALRTAREAGIAPMVEMER